MRIISGKYKGKKLYHPIETLLRPTKERAKEALFSALSHRMEWEGLSVLDLCCGTGQLGLEALSRGARHATFIDRNIAFVRHNLTQLTVPKEAYDWRQQNIFSLREALGYDIVFFDPPYEDEKLYQHVWSIPKRGLWCIELPTGYAHGREPLLWQGTYGHSQFVVWDADETRSMQERES